MAAGGIREYLGFKNRASFLLFSLVLSSFVTFARLAPTDKHRANSSTPSYDKSNSLNDNYPSFTEVKQAEKKSTPYPGQQHEPTTSPQESNPYGSNQYPDLNDGVSNYPRSSSTPFSPVADDYKLNAIGYDNKYSSSSLPPAIDPSSGEHDGNIKKYASPSSPSSSKFNGVQMTSSTLSGSNPMSYVAVMPNYYAGLATSSSIGYYGARTTVASSSGYLGYANGGRFEYDYSTNYNTPSNFNWSLPTY